jgi:general secretion pathway protein I
MKCPRRIRKDGKKGFTLLEVMIAMTILAIALVALSRSQSQSLAVTGGSREETTLCLLAQSKMAEMESGTALSTSSDKGDFGTDFPDIAWESRVSDSAIQNLKKIEVAVRDKRAAKDKPFKLVLYKFSKK